MLSRHSCRRSKYDSEKLFILVSFFDQRLREISVSSYFELRVNFLVASVACPGRYLYFSSSIKWGYNR
jgi:hypothetical protein